MFAAHPPLVVFGPGAFARPFCFRGRRVLIALDEALNPPVDG
jgi:hypothetical protein